MHTTVFFFNKTNPSNYGKMISRAELNSLTTSSRANMLFKKKWLCAYLGWVVKQLKFPFKNFFLSKKLQK